MKSCSGSSITALVRSPKSVAVICGRFCCHDAQRHSKIGRRHPSRKTSISPFVRYFLWDQTYVYLINQFQYFHIYIVNVGLILQKITDKPRWLLQCRRPILLCRCARGEIRDDVSQGMAFTPWGQGPAKLKLNIPKLPISSESDCSSGLGYECLLAVISCFGSSVIIGYPHCAP